MNKKFLISTIVVIVIIAIFGVFASRKIPARFATAISNLMPFRNSKNQAKPQPIVTQKPTVISAACLQALIAKDEANLTASESQQAAMKTHRDALHTALSAADDAARAKSMQAANQALWATMQKASTPATQQVLQKNVQEACGNSLNGVPVAQINRSSSSKPVSTSSQASSIRQSSSK